MRTPTSVQVIRSRQHAEALSMNQQRGTVRDLASSFQIMFTGQIESASFTYNNVDNLYCKYNFSYGQDWEIIHGTNSGITQVARMQNIFLHGMNDLSLVFNFPIEISFKATSAYGWPRISVQLYSTDFIGRDIIRGYGCLLCPLSSGHYTKNIYIYRPVSSSPWRRFLHWITGTPPEFIDDNFVAQDKSRHLVTVASDGIVKITLNVTTKDMTRFGYSL